MRDDQRLVEEKEVIQLVGNKCDRGPTNRQWLAIQRGRFACTLRTVLCGTTR